jgi:hypothetical protein
MAELHVWVHLLLTMAPDGWVISCFTDSETAAGNSSRGQENITLPWPSSVYAVSKAEIADVWHLPFFSCCQTTVNSALTQVAVVSDNPTATTSLSSSSVPLQPNAGLGFPKELPPGFPVPGNCPPILDSQFSLHSPVLHRFI